jgi:hypothetical protein
MLTGPSVVAGCGVRSDCNAGETIDAAGQHGVHALGAAHTPDARAGVTPRPVVVNLT